MAPSYRENKLTLDGQMTTSKKHRKILHLTLGDTMDCTVNPPGQNTGVGSLSLLQGIFPTQELNQGLLHWKRLGCWEGLGAGGKGDDRG